MNFPLSSDEFAMPIFLLTCCVSAMDATVFSWLSDWFDFDRHSSAKDFILHYRNNRILYAVSAKTGGFVKIVFRIDISLSKTSLADCVMKGSIFLKRTIRKTGLSFSARAVDFCQSWRVAFFKSCMNSENF